MTITVPSRSAGDSSSAHSAARPVPLISSWSAMTASGQVCCTTGTTRSRYLPEADGDPAQPPPPPSDPTARATTSRLVNNAADACRPIRHFARADNGIVSVGLNALELVRDM